MNQVNLIGNIGQEPEIKMFEGGKRVARFSIAINAFKKVKEGEKKPQATWIPCEMWDGAVDRLMKCQERAAVKGRKIQVTGSIALNEYTKTVGDELVKVKKLYIKVASFELLSTLNSEQESEVTQEAEYPFPAASEEQAGKQQKSRKSHRQPESVAS